MHTRYLTAIVVASVLCLQSSCVKEEINNGISVDLQLPFSVYPASDTITLGESLILESIFSTSDSLRDSRSGRMFAMTDDFFIDMFAGFNLVERDDISLIDQERNLQSYTFVNEIGRIDPLGNRTDADIYFEKVGREFRFRVRMMPSRTGVHTILPISREVMIDGNTNNVQRISNDGKDAVLVRFSARFNGGDNHYDLLLENQKNFPGFENDTSNNGTYIFYVKE